MTRHSINRSMTFSNIIDDESIGSTSLLRVCIATPDFLFFVKNMGIGTSFYHTAQVLKNSNFDVTILYCNLLNHLTTSEVESANSRIIGSGLNIDYLFEHSFNVHDLNNYYPNDLETVSSYLAYRHLKESTYDIIIFPDWRGLGFYTLQAKKMGLAFANTTIWVQAHSTCLWHGLNNEQCDYNEHDVRVFYLERKSVELADLVVSPTRYLLNWMKDHGFIFPQDTFVQPCLLTGILGKSPTSKKVSNVTELVFFGRLEKRKGLKLFIDALRIIHGEFPQDVTPPVTITFLGKITEIEGTSSYDYVLEELKGTNYTLRFLTSFNSIEAVSYLKSGDKVAVIPSIADNSPFTVLECIYNEIPFIASYAGGIPEIVNINDHEHALFRANPYDLAKKINNIVKNGAKTSFPAVNQEYINTSEWIKALRWSVKVHKKRITNDTGKTKIPISVCITTLNKFEYLSTVLNALEKQTYSNFEVLIIDNATMHLETLEYLNSLSSRKYSFPIKTIKYNKSARIGKNKLLAAARGKYIITMRDDHYPSCNQIETFYSCIVNSEFDALSCVANIVSNEDNPVTFSTLLKQYIPLGSGAAPNIFVNYYGEANCIISKDILSAICCFSTDDEPIAWESNEIFSQIALSGGKTSVVPEPLLYLRSTNDPASRSNDSVSNYYKSLRPMLSMFPWATFGDALLISIGQKLRHYTFSEGNKTKSISSRNLINTSEHSILSLRWLTKRMSEVGDHLGVITTLLSHYRVSSAFDFCLLEYISYFLNHIGSIPDAKKHCINPYEIEFLDTYGSILLKHDLDDLIYFITTRLKESIDRNILLAKLFIMNGKILEGLQMSSSVFCEVEYKYLQRNSDSLIYFPLEEDKHLNNCQFRSGVCHWLLYGINEDRIFEYCAPAISPITSSTDDTMFDYQQRIENVLNFSLDERGMVYSQMLYEALGNKSPFYLSDLATVILRDLNLSYLEAYPEAKSYISAEFSQQGIKHFIEIGRREGKQSLLTYLNINYRDIFDNYCSLVSPRIAANNYD